MAFRGRPQSRGDDDRGGFAPVKVGDELDVTIEAVGAKGDGVAKVRGFVLFVPGAQKGETVKVRVTKVFRNMGFAEVVGKGEAPAQETEGGEAAPEAEGETPAQEEASYEDSENF